MLSPPRSFMLIKEEKQTAQMDIQDSFVLLAIMRKKKTKTADICMKNIESLKVSI